MNYGWNEDKIYYLYPPLPYTPLAIVINYASKTKTQFTVYRIDVSNKFDLHMGNCIMYKCISRRRYLYIRDLSHFGEAFIDAIWSPHCPNLKRKENKYFIKSFNYNMVNFSNCYCYNCQNIVENFDIEDISWCRIMKTKYFRQYVLKELIKKFD